MATIVALFLPSSCYRVLPERGGGMVKRVPGRSIDPADVALPAGFAIEIVATGLTFPTAVAWDEAGRLHVVEAGYSYGEVFRTPRLLRVENDGRTTAVAEGEQNGPWTGVTFHKGAFFIAEGGTARGGAILRVSPDGQIRRLVEGLPTGGDHHANGPVVGPDGKLYFGLGTMTNSAVVGEDNYKFGWLKRHPDWHDIPCRDIELRGKTYESDDPRGQKGKVSTGAYSAFGTNAGTRVAGQVPCSGAVLRVSPDGGPVELVGWGFRNPYGLAFAHDKLLVTDNGYDDRGSRPIWGNADWLWIVDPTKPPRWHGWPDYADGRSVSEKRYKGTNADAPEPVLAEPPNPAPRPNAFFACHSSADGLDVARSDRFGFAGWAFVALFGDQAPVTGKVVAPSGFKVVRVDPATGIIEEFAANRGKKSGPASYLKASGLERPVAVRFNPDGSALYIVDFGVLRMDKKGSHPHEGTGVVWRVTRAPGGV